MADPTTRFWKKVSKQDNGCWLWTGALVNGYGQILVGKRRILAHRFAYELLVGPIPDGITLDHLCRVRNCVNPEHLEPCTMKDNTLRGVGLSAINARKTHCKHGHPFDAKNTYLRLTGGRTCRSCCAARERRRYLRMGLAARFANS